MDRSVSPPWNLGETFYGIGGTPQSADFHWLPGKEYKFEDPNGTGKLVTVRVVRNKATIALEPKRLVAFKTSAAGDQGFETEVDGYTSVAGQRGVATDQKLPTAGAGVNDLFFVVVDGPVIVTNDLTPGAQTDYGVGTWLTAATAAASTSTSAGRIREADFTGATSVLADAILNRVGRALSASTTDNTGDGKLVSVRNW